MKKKALIISGVFFIAGGLLMGASRSLADMSFDEFLNYSVENLQARMAELNDNNASLRQKADSIRNRILFLRQEMRSLDDKKMRLMEDAGPLRDAVQVETRLQKVGQQRQSSAGEKKDHLVQEGREFQALWERGQARQKELINEVQKLQAQVGRLQAKQVKATTRVGDVLREEKGRLRRLIDQETEKANGVRSKIRNEQARLNPLEKQKDTLEKEKIVLEEQISAAKAALEAVIGAGTSLQAEGENIRVKIQGASDNTQKEVAVLQQDSVALEETIREFQTARDQVLQTAKAQTQSLEKLQESMVEQKQVLAKSETQLQSMKNFLEAQKQFFESQRQDAQKKQEELNSQLKALHDDLETLGQNLAEQKKKQGTFGDQEKALKNEIRQWQAQAADVKQADGKQKLIVQKRDLSRQIVDQQKKNQALEKEIRDQQIKASGQADRRETLKKEGESLKAQLDAAQKNLQALDQKAKDLISSRPAQGGPEEVLNQLKADIKEMEYRKEVLTSSLGLIQSRYEGHKTAVNEFKKEEARLNQYRLDLQKENLGLAQKEQELLSIQKK